jgi:hypothetical protein
MKKKILRTLAAATFAIAMLANVGSFTGETTFLDENMDSVVAKAKAHGTLGKELWGNVQGTTFCCKNTSTRSCAAADC